MSDSELTPESSPKFEFEIHTKHNVLPPSDEEEHGKVRLSPDILQFIEDQNEVKAGLISHAFFLTES